MSEAPLPEDFRRVGFDVPGGRIAGLAFGPERANPDIVFLHATGFNARTYRALLAPLGERLSVIALDARGHGLTNLPAHTFGYTSWGRHRDDLIALMERHFTQPVMLAGHSMGAMVGLLAAGRRPDLVAGLALIEPVMMPASAAAFVQLPGGPLFMRYTLPLARGAARRRARFDTRESALEAFSGRGVFKAFPREVIADYLGDGLIEDAKRGGFKLACRPAYEAATFCAHRHDGWGALRKAQGPLVLLRAERRSTIAPAAAHRIAALKPEARIATVEGASHMLPMERPDRTRAAIETATLMARQGRHWRDAGEL